MSRTLFKALEDIPYIAWSEIILISLLLGICMPLAAKTVESGVYFWHRERNQKTDELLSICTNWKQYVLRGEIREKEPNILLRNSSCDAVPVFRLDSKVWRKSGFIEKFSEILAKEVSAEIQIDCDVPESKLLSYAFFLEKLRLLVPNKHFSVTLLPCHLTHEDELKKIFQHISYYVLQLHALDKPDDLLVDYHLFDYRIADRAMKQAIALKKEFRMALPCYAYRLHYAKKTGKFLRISAENMPPQQVNEKRKIAVPDWKEILQFRKSYANIPVIWFRLPLAGDRLCLELENLKRLDAGKLPVKKIETFFKTCGSRVELYWKNYGILGEETYIQTLGKGFGEAFFFNGIQSVAPVIPGCIPEKIQGIIPCPGETLKVGEIYQ